MRGDGLDDIIGRMDMIYRECGGKEEQPEEQKGKEVLNDEFSVKRHDIHQQVHEIRAKIKERDDRQEEAGNDFSEKIVRLGQEIRVAMDALSGDVDELQNMLDVNKTKKRKKYSEDQLNNQEAIFQLCQRHFREVELLEKKKYSELKPKSQARSQQALALFTGAKKTQVNAMESDLPEITGDIADGLRVIGEQEKIIDQKLDIIGEGLAVVKQQQEAIKDELDIQADILEVVNDEADETQAKLDTEMSRARALLQRVKKNDKWLIYIIMVLLVVALLVWLANMVWNFGSFKIKAALGV